jgi:quinol-cytochrome oxidoreductase complex cytochrome b subunit
VFDWLEKRYGLREVLDGLLQPPIPLHRESVLYGVGGALLFLLAVQLLTGLLLLVYYVPTPEGAHASIELLQERVRFGPLVRSIHSWASHLLVGGVFLHLVIVFAGRAYRRPREATWVGGLLLFGLVLAIVFTGRALPQDETARFASLIGISIVETMPLVGAFLGRLVKGGDIASGLTLGRFFAFHVAILPLVAALLVGLHLFAVHRQGLSVPPKFVRPDGDMPTLPFADYLPRQLLVWVFLANLLVILALRFPADLGPPADLLAPVPPGTRPEWYFWPLYQMHRMLPPRILGLEAEVVFNLVLVLVGGVFLTLPFWDRAARAGRAGSAVTAVGVAVLVVLAGFFVRAWLS